MKGVHLDAATVQIDQEIRETILSMGADYTNVVRLDEVMYVTFHRLDGCCGRIYVNVCRYLAKRFQDMEIVVLESPKEGKFCSRARVRQPGETHFARASVLATADRLGVA